MGSKNYLLFLILTTIYSSASSSSSFRRKKRIFNGVPAEIKDYPYVVLVEVPGKLTCTGVIVSKYNVLTAAHCLFKKKSKYVIQAGTSLHRIKTVTKHQNFSIDSIKLKTYFDLAVISVKETFKYDETRQPIRLFESGEFYQPSVKAESLGWGRTQNNQFPELFHKLDVEIVDRKTCNESVKSYVESKSGVDSSGLSKGQICAQSEDPKSEFLCDGDSGGPLVINNKLAGIAIYGGGCEVDGSPTVFSEVAYFRDWIDQHVTYD